MRSLLALAWLAVASAALAQPTFTKVTDPDNPLVHDMLETGGMSWVDLDGDSLLDVFVAHGNLSNQDNALYRNLGGFQFARVTTGAVMHDGGSSIGGAWGDWNGDGKPDLFVTNRNNFGNFLYQGLGDTSFVRVNAATDVANSNSASWVDLDGDGDLDLYVVNFNADDFLYVNGGAPGFALTRDATRAITVSTEFSIAGNWSDVNEDGRPDLFVGNAGGQDDALWINQGGLNFVRTTIPDGRTTLGGSWGDFDDDGHMDFFAANFLNQASVLYRNAGPPTYALQAVAAGAMTTEPANTVGSAWGDVDNDGDLDLYVARDGQAQAMYLNDGPPSHGFTKVLAGDQVTTVSNAFGCGMVDVDRDGWLDLFVANRLNQADLLYENGGGAHHWLSLHLVGAGANTTAIGARVRVRATIGGVPRWMTREVQAQGGYNSQVVDLHFGLGDATGADSVVVRWPSGAVESFPGVQADERRTIVEAVGVVAVPPRSPKFSLQVVPQGARFAIRYSLPAPGTARLQLFDVRGRLVRTVAGGDSEAGAHVSWLERRDLPASGLYFLRLVAPGHTAVARVVNVR